MKGLMCKQLYVPLAILLICMFLIAGCGGSPATTTSNPAATTTNVVSTTTPATTQTSAPPTTTALAATTVSPKYGGTLTIGSSSGSPLNLGFPAKRGGPNDRYLSGPCGEQLIDSSFGNYVPWLAESWDIAPDGKSITFKIRQGVKFHDGTTLNAAAVKVNFDLVRTSTETTIFKSVTSIDVVDEYTVRLNLTQFEWGIMSNIATNAGCRILSAKALTENTPEQLLFKPVGTGPFKFVSYQKDTVIKYVRFEDYWQKGKPYLDAIDYKIFANASTATMAMKAGEVDILNVSAEDMLDLKKSGFNIAECIGKVALLIPDGANADSPFADVRVRKALSYAIDRENLAKSLGYGYYYPTQQPFQEGSMAYNPNIVGYPYDQAKAKQLLTEAGYPNGFKTSIITGSAATDLHLGIQDMLAEVGIQAEIQEVTGAKFSEMSVVSGWQNGMLCMASGIGEGHQDPYQSLLYLYMSQNAMKSRYYPDNLKTLFKQTNTEMDTVKRKAVFQDMMKQVVDDACMATHIYITTNFFAVSPDVHFPQFKTYHSIMSRMDDFWRDK